MLQNKTDNLRLSCKKLELNAQDIKEEIDHLQTKVESLVPPDSTAHLNINLDELTDIEDEMIDLLGDLNNISRQLDTYSMNVYQEEPDNLEKYSFTKNRANKIERIIKNSLELLPFEGLEEDIPPRRRPSVTKVESNPWLLKNLPRRLQHVLKKNKKRKVDNSTSRE